MAYIEFARTSPALHYKGVNVHKVVALLIMPTLSAVNDRCALSDSWSSGGRVILLLVE